MSFTTKHRERRKQQRRLAYSQAEMADMIGVSLATAGRMIKNKIVGSVKVGNRRLIPETEIQKLLTPAP
jgi:excisionase family DNA binding protein